MREQRFAGLLLSVLMMTCATGAVAPEPSLVPPATPLDPQRLLDLMFESTAPLLLFTYSVETTVSFDYNGEPLSSRQVYRCEVIHDRGTIDEKRDRIIGTTAGSASPHFVLSGGAAIVLFGFNPCTWTSVPPAFGPIYDLLPVAQSDQPPADPGRDLSADVMGSVAVLDSAATPKHIETYDLAAFVRTPQVSNFHIAAEPTYALPANTLTADVPSLAAVADSTSKPAYLTAGQANRPVEGAVFFQISPVMSAYDADEAARSFANFAGGQHWVMVRGFFGPTGPASAAVSIGDDPARIDVDPKTPSPKAQVGLMLPWVTAKVPTHPRGKLTAWAFNICLEGDCIAVDEFTPLLVGGEQIDYYTLYHPPTGRMMSLDISKDDLSRLLH